MKSIKEPKTYEFTDQGLAFSKSVHNWLAQYDEEEDFLCGKVSSSLPDFLEEE